MYVCNYVSMYYLADVSIDENVAAVEVSVDDTRLVRVEINQAFEYLLWPLLQSSHWDVSVLLPVLSEVPGGTDLGDEVQDAVFLVSPHFIQLDDVIVVQALEQPDLGEKPLDHGRVVDETSQLDLVPRDFYAFFLVKRSVDFFDGARAQELVVPTVSTSRIRLHERLRVIV